MARKYQFSDFVDNNAWLIFRLDAFIQSDPIDIYVVMDLPSGFLLDYDIIEGDPSQKQVDALIEKAMIKKGKVPEQILIPNNDPLVPLFQKSPQKLQAKIVAVTVQSIKDLTKDAEHAFVAYQEGYVERDGDNSDYECAKRSIPDSYDFCPCNSGLKYKFCCKRIFLETVEAMCAAEEGKFKEALEWIAKMKKLVGNTAEVLCRESIVYSFFDIEKSKEILVQCLKADPKHPRAHYLLGINLKAQGDLQGAVEAYERAVSYYPPTDHYHLNEVHNNLGGVYFDLGNLAKAKAEFELALHFWPEDKIARRNLQEFIFCN